MAAEEQQRQQAESGREKAEDGRNEAEQFRRSAEEAREMRELHVSKTAQTWLGALRHDAAQT